MSSNFNASTGQYQVNVPTALGRTGENLRGAANVILAQLSDANLPRDVRGLQSALQNLLAALDGLLKSQLEQIDLSLDATLNQGTKLQRMGASFQKAADAADVALDGLDAQIEAAARALNKLLLPQKPQGASDVAIEGAASRLERLLPNTAPELMTAAPALLQELIDSGDDLAAFVLCGQQGSPLGLFYRAVSWTAGIDMNGFIGAMARSAARARGNDAPTAQAATLFGLVSGGGPNTVRGIIDQARWAVNDWRKAMSSYAAGMDPHRYDFPR